MNKIKASMRATKKNVFPWQYGISQASSSIAYDCFRFNFSEAKEPASDLFFPFSFIF